MPEINHNNNIININEVRKPSSKDKIQELMSDEVSTVEVESTDLKNDPKCIIGRSLVHSTKSKEAKALKKRVASYTDEFLKDKEKATFIMDSIDTFKEAGYSLEESTELTLALAGKFGKKAVDSFKEIPGTGSTIAEICSGFMKEFNWDPKKSIDATVKTFEIINSKTE